MMYTKTRAALTFLAQIIVVVCTATVTTAQEPRFKPGDRVVVVPESAEFRVGAQVVGKLSKGQQLSVNSLQGQWVGCALEIDGQTNRGWLLSSQLSVVPHARRDSAIQFPAANPAPPAASKISQSAVAKLTSQCLDGARASAKRLDDWPVIQSRAFVEIAVLSKGPSDCEAARRAASRIQDKGEDLDGPIAFGEIACISHDPADFKAARDAISRIENSFVGIKGYWPLAKAYAKAGDFPAALEAIGGASHYLNIYTYGHEDIARAALEQKDFATARATVKLIYDLESRARLYVDIAAVTNDPSDIAVVRTAMGEIINRKKSNRAFSAAASACIELYRATKDPKDLDSARENAQSILSTKAVDYSPDTYRQYTRAITYTSIAEHSHNPADIAAARDAAAKCELKESCAAAYLGIYNVSKDPKDLSAATEAAGAITNAQNESHLFEGLAVAHAEQGDMQAALAAQKRVEMYPLNGYANIAGALAESGNAAAARGMIEDMEGSEAHYYRAGAYSALAALTREPKDFEAARREAEQVEADSSYCYQAYLKVVAALCGKPGRN